MALGCKLRFLMFFIATVTSALEVSELMDVDHSLNPRLVGAVYNLYKPMKPSKMKPITIDCNHPSVICKFGPATLVSPEKECDCKQYSVGGEVPVIVGLTENKNKNTDSENEGDSFPLPSDKVPIYSGVINTDAILSDTDHTYKVWNFQRNSLDKGWRQAQDPTKTKVGELPRKFSSYYPFTKPNLPNWSEETPNFYPPNISKDFFPPDIPDGFLPPVIPDDPPRVIYWGKSGFTSSSIKSPSQPTSTTAANKSKNSATTDVPSGKTR